MFFPANSGNYCIDRSSRREWMRTFVGATGPVPDDNRQSLDYPAIFWTNVFE